MYINDSFQLNIILYSVGFGFFAALLYDIFKIIHSAIFKSVRFLFVKDFIYSIVTAFLYFIFLLAINNGKIRVYILIGTILGYICWFILLSSLFIRIATLIINKLISFFTSTASVITFPFRVIFSLLLPIISKTNEFINKIFEKIRNKLKIHLKKK